MRQVIVSRETIQSWLNDQKGRCLAIPVKVGWPELQLTEQQILENSLALLGPNPIPHNDNSIFNVVVE